MVPPADRAKVYRVRPFMVMRPDVQLLAVVWRGVFLLGFRGAGGLAGWVQPGCRVGLVWRSGPCSRSDRWVALRHRVDRTGWHLWGVLSLVPTQTAKPMATAAIPQVMRVAFLSLTDRGATSLAAFGNAVALRVGLVQLEVLGFVFALLCADNGPPVACMHFAYVVVWLAKNVGLAQS